VRVPTQDRRFARQHRLTARRLYLAVYDEGWRFPSTSFTVFAAPGTTGVSRLGLTVPKRIASACRRNRVKRLLREVFRLHRARLIPAVDLVVNARSGIETRSYDEIEREFLDCMRRLARRTAAQPRGEDSPAPPRGPR
jgi:ribonuclease P protein component